MSEAKKRAKTGQRLKFSGENQNFDVEKLMAFHVFRVRAILREDEGSDVVQELRSCGVEVCQLREYNEGIIRYVLEDCHGCFLATKTAFTEPNFQHNEVCQCYSL